MEDLWVYKVYGRYVPVEPLTSAVCKGGVTAAASDSTLYLYAVNCPAADWRIAISLRGRIASGATYGAGGSSTNSIAVENHYSAPGGSGILKYTTGAGATGTVTITRLTDSLCAGTFSASLQSPYSTTPDFSIRDGRFDIPLR